MWEGGGGLIPGGAPLIFLVPKFLTKKFIACFVLEIKLRVLKKIGAPPCIETPSSATAFNLVYNQF